MDTNRELNKTPLQVAVAFYRGKDSPAPGKVSAARSRRRTVSTQESAQSPTVGLEVPDFPRPDSTLRRGRIVGVIHTRAA
jgi:hypothetical protein